MNNKIENMIYEIRGKQVMLDSDLAKLYQCKNGTKSINLAVSRNKERFPERFMFQLSQEEMYDLRFQVETTNQKSLNIQVLKSQLGTTNKIDMSKVRTLPYAFTEQGVAMLATILRTEVAVEVSIRIMDAFVAMRKYISNNLLEQKYINNMLMKHDDRLIVIENTLNKLKEKRIVNEIYFKGQIYDAYSKIVDIMKRAKNELIVIDSFLDKEKVYHLGASINHAGSKTFSINVLEDKVVKDSLISNIYNNMEVL